MTLREADHTLYTHVNDGEYGNISVGEAATSLAVYTEKRKCHPLIPLTWEGFYVKHVVTGKIRPCNGD